jgi:hypothetical protein
MQVLGPHLDVKYQGKRVDKNGKELPSSKKEFVKLEEALKKDMQTVLDFAAAENLQTVGELAMFINGTRHEWQGGNKDYSLKSHLNSRRNNNPDAMYNVIAEKGENPLYNSIKYLYIA